MPQRARNLGRNIWLDWNGNQWNLVRGLFPSRLGALAIRILPQARPFPPEPRVPSSPFSRNAQQLRTDSCPGSGILWPLQENVSNGFLALFSFRPYKQALKDSDLHQESTLLGISPATSPKLPAPQYRRAAGPGPERLPGVGVLTAI